MKYRVHQAGKDYVADVTHVEGAMEVQIEGQTFRIDEKSLNNAIRIHSVVQKGSEHLLCVAGKAHLIQIENPRDYKTAALGDGALSLELRASIPGRIMKVHVKAGDSVIKGQALLILEAMKMENELKAGGDAIVETVHISEGQAVESNALLLTFRS